MRGTAKAGFVLLAVVLLMIGAGLSLYAPTAAKNKIENIIAVLGFQDFELNKRFSGISATTYSAKLDQQEFSTIEKIQLTYNPLNALFKSNKGLTIENLMLTGSLDENNNISINSWSPRPFPQIIQQLFYNDTVSVKNAQASLLSDSLGGISSQLDMAATRSNKGMDVEGTLNTTHKYLRLKAYFEGFVNSPNAWHNTFHIKNAKLSYPQIKAARISGEVAISKEEEGEPQIDGELNAGNLVIGSSSWKEAAISFDGKLETPKFIIGAKSSNHEGLELGLVLYDLQKFKNLSGFAFSENFEALPKLMEDYNHPLFNPKTLEPLSVLKNTEVTFEKLNNSYQLDIKNAGRAINITALVQMLQNEDQENYIKKAIIENNTEGLWIIKNKAFFNLIKNMPENEKKQIRQAFSNLYYKKLLVEANQIKDDRYSFSFKVRGSNPDMNSGREFNLSFEIEATIDKLLKAML